MKNLTHALLLSVGVVTAFAALPARAHYLWIERQGGVAVVHFGEYEEGAMERSPGRLDEIRSPAASIASDAKEQPIKLDKEADGFRFAAKNSRDPLLVREAGLAVRDWSKQGIGVVKPMFYARHAASFAATPAVLQLDITPNGKVGEFRVWFNGNPLPKTAVKIVAPNGWIKEEKTGEDGKVSLPMPWGGQYILQVIHKETRAGEFDGAPFDAVRHRVTLTIPRNDGPKTFAPKFSAGME